VLEAFFGATNAVAIVLDVRAGGGPGTASADAEAFSQIVRVLEAEALL
jgi:hypothetical protein